ncbi:MAG: 1-aminocyclopropane-1-carboxylate deaminase/D-cysteine desulfhydrase [Alkaliphilus sp.]
MKILEAIPKIDLGCYPTPFYKIENLSKKTGLNLFIKREDLSGLGLGGNKIRKLEYLLADAKQKKSDTIITTGAAQSNHAMLTAAACRVANLESILVLKERGVTSLKGNLLLSKILDTEVHFVDTDDKEIVKEEIDNIVKQLEFEGKKPYFIPTGGSVPLGVLGYVSAVFEILTQAEREDIRIDHIVCASGSGGIQAGLIAGMKLLDKTIKITGINISSNKELSKVVADLANGAFELLASHKNVLKEEVIVKNYVGEGYAIPSKEGTKAIKLVARSEGIMLDHVYTGKAFGGLLSLAEIGYFEENENILFIHTGGVPALFAIDAEF